MKLRRGEFDPLSVELPGYLSGQGLRPVVAPLPARSDRLWAGLAGYTAILYPFIDGRDGYQVELLDRQWIEFGAALKRIHTLPLPVGLAARLHRETWSPQWRRMASHSLERAEHEAFAEPVAAKTAEFLKLHRAQTLDLIQRAERYAAALAADPPSAVLCHGDLHAGNLLVCPDGAFFIVDWDDPILAPKERDLMFVGGAQGFRGHTLEEEEDLFYRGYGPAQVDRLALAYYRCERIVTDIALFCQQLLGSDEGGEDREQSFRYLVSNFQPGNTIEAAYRADADLR